MRDRISVDDIAWSMDESAPPPFLIVAWTPQRNRPWVTDSYTDREEAWDACAFSNRYHSLPTSVYELQDGRYVFLGPIDAEVIPEPIQMLSIATKVEVSL